MNKTPKLRFKEFSGDWESKKLGTVASLVKDGTHGTHADVECGPYLLSAKNIKDGKIIITSDDRKISDEDYKSIYKNYSLEKDDILLSIVGTIGRIAVMPQIENIAFQRSVAILRFNLDARYVYQYMNTNIFQNQLLKKQVVSAQPGIYLNDLKKLDMSIPSKEEQEKIASFFSLIDDKISLQGEKVDALKDYKKGMMQKIFSRELRFKDDDGRDYPEWEEKKLNQLGDTYTGLSGKTKENFGIGKAKYVIYKNVFGNTLAKEEEVDLVEINEGENQNKVAKGDLLFTTSSETPEEVGMISCWNYDIDDLYLNSFCFGYRLFDLERYSPIFIAYLLRSEAYRRKISILGQGSTRYNMSKTELMKMKVSVPNIEEQRKIVSLLLGIESKIEKEQEKLDYLNEYKKGLLQQMFI